MKLYIHSDWSQQEIDIYILKMKNRMAIDYMQDCFKMLQDAIIARDEYRIGDVMRLLYNGQEYLKKDAELSTIKVETNE